MQDGVTEANWAPKAAPEKPTVQLTNMPQNKFKLSTTEGATRVRFCVAFPPSNRSSCR
jgi:hypothetical protein